MLRSTRALASAMSSLPSSCPFPSCSMPSLVGNPSRGLFRRRETGAATTAAAAAAVSRRNLAASMVLIGAAAGAGFPRGAAAVAAARRPDVENSLKGIEWPLEPPFSPEDFSRYDESDDALFYDAPRFVTHIDDAAIASLTSFYAETFPSSSPSSSSGATNNDKSNDVALLDLCSSWISHYPKDMRAERVVGLGMNADELRRNPQLTEFVVRDLNSDPSLPFADAAFDVVTNCVSVDYLTKPFEVFREMARVTKPGGLAICAFSNRMFPTKAVSLWTSTDDADHARIVASFFHYSSPEWEEAQVKDITRSGIFGGSGDPMYVVYARKKK